MKVLNIFLFFTISIPLFSQSVIHVPSDWPTIQSGLDAAIEGDTVLVAPGNYYESISWPSTNGINLISAGTRENTVINGNGTSDVIFIANNPSAVIKDFTIRNGLRGIYCQSNQSPSIINVIIENNFNTSIWGGGIIIKGSASLNNVIIKSNTGEHGGGIFIDYNSTAVLNNVIIFDNTASKTGGGIFVNDYASAIMNNVIIAENSALQGGGMYFEDLVTTDISEITISGNKSTQIGGGIYSRGNLNITAVTFIDNHSITDSIANFFQGSYPEFANCNFINNRGNAVHHGSTEFLDARNNYFGDSSGPYHPTQNPAGMGDSVNLYVRVNPWLTEPSITAPPIPALNLGVISATNNSITLKWDQSKMADIAGYKVHYNDDSTSYDFSNTIDVGTDTNYTITNLDAGEDYFISVTTYDIDGNESWFSKIIRSETISFPLISLNSYNINFGQTTIDLEKEMILTIKNIGNESLSVFNINTLTSKFYTNVVSINNILPNDSTELPVYFKPDELGEFSDTLSISSNSNQNSLLKIPLVGIGADPLEPTILGIQDVPEDQGGFIRIEFRGSRLDGAPGDSSIQTYSVWRKIPESDEWDAIGLFNAIQEPIYNYVARTLGDSTDDGIFWSVYKISAHPADPIIYFMSDPDSGYSVDNIAPEAPTNFTAKELDLISGILLEWESNDELDFSYYSIYKGLEENFIPDSINLIGTTIDTSFVDTDIIPGTYYYKLSAIDYSGNESEFTSASILLVDVEDKNKVPTEFSLQQNYPNPFNPTTVILYSIAEEFHTKLVVYDLLGNEIKVLVDDDQEIGNHQVEFDASGLTSGIYYYRITAGNFRETKKMILLK